MSTTSDSAPRGLGRRLASFICISAFVVGTSCSHREVAPPAGQPVQREREVVVVGAGTGGVAAAIQAARGGALVTLIEETDWVGGQMTAAGVSMMDEGLTATRRSGIYAEFIERVKAYYLAPTRFAVPKPLERTSYFGYSIGIEPHVGQRILLEMLADMPPREDGSPAIRLLTRRRLLEIERIGDVVVGLVTCDKRDPRCRATPVPTEVPREIHASRVMIDATEYGDLLPLARAPYRVANTTSDTPDPSLIDRRCIQDITYAAVVRKYGQLPQELRVVEPPPGYSQVAPKFRASNFQNQLPWAWENHVRYRAMVDSLNPLAYDATQGPAITKTGLNWDNDYPAGVGLPFLPARFLEDATYRREHTCQAKLRTLQYLYYVQTELQQPWSLATEEGYDTPYNLEENLCAEIPEAFKSLERHFPVMPYVRESRRAIGRHGFALKAADIRREGVPLRAQRNLTTAIAVADYQNDLHGCDAQEFIETQFESVTDIPTSWQVGPFQVPMEALIPAGVQGLLVAEKNLAQTRIVNGATRLQPSTMHTGQAAGALAAEAIVRGVHPDQVQPIHVQSRLVNSAAPISILAPYRADWRTGYGLEDVPATSPSWASVQLVTTAGIMTTYGSQVLFGADEGLQLGHGAVALVRALGLSPLTADSLAHLDATALQNPSTPYVGALVEQRVLEKDAFARAGHTLTREEWNQMVGRALAYWEQWPQGDPDLDAPSPRPEERALQQRIFEPCHSGDALACARTPVTRLVAAQVLARFLTLRSASSSRSSRQGD